MAVGRTTHNRKPDTCIGFICRSHASELCELLEHFDEIYQRLPVTIFVKLQCLIPRAFAQQKICAQMAECFWMFCPTNLVMGMGNNIFEQLGELLTRLKLVNALKHIIAIVYPSLAKIRHDFDAGKIALIGKCPVEIVTGINLKNTCIQMSIHLCHLSNYRQMERARIARSRLPVNLVWFAPKVP